MIVTLSRLTDKNEAVDIKGELHIHENRDLIFYADHPFKIQMNNGVVCDTELRLTITNLSMDKYTLGIKGLRLLEGKQGNKSARYGEEYLTFRQWID